MTDPLETKISEAALHWFIRRRDADFSAAEMRDLEAWLAADPRHREAYAEVQADWQVLDRQNDVLTDMLYAERAVEKDHRKPRGWALAAMAASLVLASVVVLGVLLGAPERQLYVTDYRETRDVALEDGSLLNLGAATRVEVEMSASQRSVWLQSGRAYFDVQSDPERPFIVTALDREIRVVGTKFSVALDERGARLAVAEGGVKIVGEADLALSAGQQIRFSEAQPVGQIGGVDPEKVGLWRQGLFYFDRTPLPEAIDILNQFYGDVFDIEDASLDTLRLSGVYQQVAPVELAEVLEAILPLEVVEADDGRIMILPKANQ